jgi:hypothetical protein
VLFELVLPKASLQPLVLVEQLKLEFITVQPLVKIAEQVRALVRTSLALALRLVS